MEMARRGTSRDRILRAASELAFKEGAAHLSLDAVAARAGVSKGGLL
ncbi:MAG: TetR family transcriptional regulator, partial [Hyphomicrobiales bacterium]|nr:TetR family transcriptional regulator [Hyphomicrobiales bacterium]